jgi:hypothetical protein
LAVYLQTHGGALSILEDNQRHGRREGGRRLRSHRRGGLGIHRSLLRRNGTAYFWSVLERLYRVIPKTFSAQNIYRYVFMFKKPSTFTKPLSSYLVSTWYLCQAPIIYPFNFVTKNSKKIKIFQFSLSNHLNIKEKFRKYI